MALSPQFLDELRARTPLPALIGRRVKLRRSGREWVGCCPFHNEKSPSFRVYEAHFHCYGCGAHGDAISFWMQSTGATFPETVELLAAEAGLEVPKPSRAQAQAEQRRLDLHEILGRAQESFVRRLQAPEGEAARAYLRGRGLSDRTIAAFGLGWSGDGRGSLIAELRDAGVPPERALDAGLLRETEEGARRELFWGRVTFPIHDRSGRLISFGGRAMGDAKPKYINGPDTEIFHKRQTLYAAHRVREPLRASHELIVAEGYMDVIALHQAGFPGAVAPLGTALTEQHLAELWRLAPNPILCFDGDAAGARAAERAILLALPQLKPGNTLRIASLPEGQDPDSLLRSDGPAAFARRLAEARPLADALYAALAQGAGDQPEQRAALRTRLDAAAATIPDQTLASEFRSALRQRFFDAHRRRTDKPAPSAHRATRVPLDPARERARLLTAIILRHPEILRDVEEAYAGLDLAPDLVRLREHILHFDGGAQLDSETLLNHLKASGLANLAETVLSAAGPRAAGVQDGAMPAEAVTHWWHFYGLMNRHRLEDELASARRDFDADPEQSARRLIGLRRAIVSLDSLEDDTDT